MVSRKHFNVNHNSQLTTINVSHTIFFTKSTSINLKFQLNSSRNFTRVNKNV